ncbi:serpin family protein [Sedimentibacter sp.]|uniref:serpin family protein n=1 Tax=Sedimentibacter sp. TaxID=1960295 RepID=UPI002896C272|nr:serpin family protein [Sedimentibacter sp.]
MNEKNEKKIFDAITDVPDEMIEEARVTRLRRTGAWRKWTAAACITVIAAIGWMFFGEEKQISNIGPILDIVYPRAYAFHDFDTRREIINQNPVEESFVKAINDFSYNTASFIFSENGEKDGGKNINYSPLSLYYALSMAASGAKNETEAQLLELLGVDDSKMLSEQCGNLYRLLYKDNEIGKLKIANSIWMDDDMNGDKIEFKDDFVKKAAENFYASSYSVDFAKEETAEAMARWISANTNGTLSPKIETDTEQILSILNTVYFYDQWTNRFDKSKTAEDTFYLSNGEEVRCDFMNRESGSARFFKGDGFIRASLNMKNNSQMIFILPDEGISPYELISSPEQMKVAFEGGEEYHGDVVWKIPKFSFSSKLSLTDALKNLGVNSAFTEDADFTGMTDHITYISSIMQETHIDIDEDGVEASAFTDIRYVGGAPPQGRAEMILNRPFIYAVTSQYEGILFMGICENPTE